jgi:DNA-binding CsgD family transcriptional regulator
MREAEATLGQHRDRPRAANALASGVATADRLRATPLGRAIRDLAGRAGIDLARAGDAAGSATDDEPPGKNAATHVIRAKEGRRALRGRYDLTPREREVLELVAAGLADGEIADRLFISRKTASVHVASIKGKLGARSRVEIATDAISFGLIESPTGVPPAG